MAVRAPICNPPLGKWPTIDLENRTAPGASFQFAKLDDGAGLAAKTNAGRRSGPRFDVLSARHNADLRRARAIASCIFRRARERFPMTLPNGMSNASDISR